jgi:hypothetical protein
MRLRGNDGQSVMMPPKNILVVPLAKAGVQKTLFVIEVRSGCISYGMECI